MAVGRAYKTWRPLEECRESRCAPIESQSSEGTLDVALFELKDNLVALATVLPVVENGIRRMNMHSPSAPQRL
jgi:hypothetical protein